jgi:acyl-CoA synthetase (AMP-forming)/AMP-acid ligase II
MVAKMTAKVLGAGGFALVKKRLDAHKTLTYRRPLEAELSRTINQQGAEPQLAFVVCCVLQDAVYLRDYAIEFIVELPKSESGKILWRDLQEREQAKMAEANNCGGRAKVCPHECSG